MTATAVDYGLSPLFAYREDIAQWFADQCGVTTFSDLPGSVTTPCIYLTGGGWTAGTGGWVRYLINVGCLYTDQAGTSLQACEELTRKAYLAAVGIDPGVELGPATEVGGITFGDRTYTGATFTMTALINLEG